MESNARIYVAGHAGLVGSAVFDMLANPTEVNVTRRT